jgi:integrase
MAGAKPLNNEEVESILNNLKGPRNKALFVFGLKTGFRISEILSVRVQDVVQYGKITDSITVSRANMKGQKSSRSVVMNPDLKAALEAMRVQNMNPGDHLFPFKLRHAAKILKAATQKAQVMGKVSTHSMRKTFAKKVHAIFNNDIAKTQKAIGHKSLSSTVHYLQFDQPEIDSAILSI